MIVLERQGGATSRLREEAIEYRLTFAASFVLFLAAAVAGRLLPRRWRPFPAGPKGSGSVIGEARTAALTFVPLVFMG